MDLRDFYRILMRNLSVVITFMILGIASAFGITSLMTPMYEARTQLFVTTPSSSFDLSAVIQGSSFSQQRVKSYAQIINGPTTLNPVIKKYNLEITAEQLAKRIKASAPLDTVLINVTVSDESPRRAALIADAVSYEFSTTVNKLELAKDKELTPIKVSVVKTATIPKSPATPRTTLNLVLGLILGAGIGIGIGIIRLIFDRSIKNESDLGDVPLLAAIGFDKTAPSKPLITQIGKYHPRTEAFRQLRTNIQYLKSDIAITTIAVTSALPGEGKSTATINMGISFAQAGMKILIIEADLRRPKISSYLSISKDKEGLTELLTSERTITRREVQEKIIELKDKQIDVLPSGQIPDNPAEILDSDSFAEIIELLEDRYDYIFIDCPPSIPVADASIIATKTDGVIMITRAGETKIDQFQGVKDSLQNVGSKIIGTILNMIPKSRVYGDYGYRYGYGYGRSRYGYYSTYEPEVNSNGKPRNTSVHLSSKREESLKNDVYQTSIFDEIRNQIRE